MTDFESKCRILGELWMNYRDQREFKEFIEYNDIGLPLAYLVSEKLAEITGQGEIFIEETFALFLTSMGLEDEGFTELNDILELG